MLHSPARRASERQSVSSPRTRLPNRVYHMPRKQKRRLEPAYLIAHGDVEEVRFQAGNYWHTATPAGLTFNCKCQAGQHTVTWQEDIPLILAILSAHRDQLWKVLCDGERMLL